MPKPILHVFAISHYCEKARWALDYLGVDYQLSHLPPGVHIKVAQKLGAPGTSMPILENGDQVIQGSADIIDWAEKLSGKSLTPENCGQECREIEKRLDDVTGVHMRRYYYSEAMVEYPETIKPIFAKHLSLLHKLILNWKWKLIRGLMIKRLDLGPEQFDESKSIVEGELDWLDGLLADGRPYLTGHQFSRADMTAASLLAPLAQPAEHPVYTDLTLPPRLTAHVAGWQSRPIVGWIRNIYAKHR